MRIRDWSSDVCSSDLLAYPVEGASPGAPHAAGLTRILLDDMIALLGEAVDAKHDALAAKVAGEFLDQLRMFQRRGIDGYLVGPGLKASGRLLARPEASRHGKRYVDPRSEEHTSELQSLMRISYA